MSEVDSRACRRLQRDLMRRLASQFDEKQNAYVRMTPHGQLHVMEFGRARHRPEFCVDIGIHFVGVPDFSFISALRSNDFSCAWQSRWRDADNQQFFPYGESLRELELFLTQIIADCLEEFEDFESCWQDGRPLLRELTPERVAEDLAQFEKVRAIPLEDRDEFLSQTWTHRFFPRWMAHPAPKCLVLAELALRFAQPAFALDYLELIKGEEMGLALYDSNSYIIELVKRARQASSNSS